jgi:hypothetical protein
MDDDNPANTTKSMRKIQTVATQGVGTVASTEADFQMDNNNPANTTKNIRKNQTIATQGIGSAASTEAEFQMDDIPGNTTKNMRKNQTIATKGAGSAASTEAEFQMDNDIPGNTTKNMCKNQTIATKGAGSAASTEAEFQMDKNNPANTTKNMRKNQTIATQGVGSVASYMDSEPPLDKYQNAESFYSYYYDRLVELVNETTVMQWRFSWNHLVDHFNVTSIDRFDDEALQTLAETETFYYRIGDLCSFINLMSKYRANTTAYPANPKPHVLFSGLSMDGGTFTKKMKHCPYERIVTYLDHADTLAVFTSGDQDNNYGPKVFSIPIGIKGRPQYKEAVLKEIQWIKENKEKNFGHLASQRKNLLMLNAQPWMGRKPILDALVESFNRTGYYLKNTYGYPSVPRKDIMNSYFSEMKESKFIVSPKGLGKSKWNQEE